MPLTGWVTVILSQPRAAKQDMVAGSSIYYCGLRVEVCRCATSACFIDDAYGRKLTGRLPSTQTVKRTKTLGWQADRDVGAIAQKSTLRMSMP